MEVYVVVDFENNVYGVCDSIYEFEKAREKLKGKYPNVFFDYITCELNEIIDGDEIL